MKKSFVTPWRVLAACLLLVAITLAGCAEAEEAPVRGQVQWIYDGDTIKVAGIGKVRLIGIDTPEREDSDRDRFYRRWDIPPKRLRRIASEVLQFNISRVKGKTVTLSFDQEKTDRFGRTLAYVALPDGRLLNRLLLEKGYATVYRRFDFRLKDDFLTAENIARNKQLGLWSR